MTFTAPDGTEYELRDTATGGQPFTVGNCASNETSRGTTFATADGAAAYFVSDAAITDPLYNYPHDVVYPSGYLHLRDGSTYRIVSGTPAWMRDRNGNTLNWVSQVSSTNTAACDPLINQCFTKITDSVNRVITVTHDGNEDIVTYQGFGGASRTITVTHSTVAGALAPGFESHTLNELFPELPDADKGSGIFPDVIRSVELPNGQAYQFRYNDYGELAWVQLPTGGIITYEWTGGLVDGNESGYTEYNGTIYRRIVSRKIYANEATLENEITISRPETLNSRTSSVSNTGYVDVTTLDANSTYLNAARHFYYGSSFGSMGIEATQYPSWQEGKEYRTEYYATNWTTLLRKTEQTWNNDTPNWWGGSSAAAPSNLSRVDESTTTFPDTGQITKETFEYDSFNNLTDTYSYDYGTMSGGSFTGTLLRRSHTDYVTDTNYTGYSGSHLRSLPSQSWVSSDAAGSNKVSLVQYEYDNYTPDTLHAALWDRTSITGRDSGFGTSYVRRGNVTKVTSYTDASNASGAISVASQYDIAGNVIKTIDPRGCATTIGYDDSFGAPDANARINSAPSQLSGNSTFAFPTSSTNCLNFNAYVQFDFFTGKPVDAEDIIGTVSSAVYDDPLDRQTQVIVASNVSTLMNQSNITYDDTNHKTTVESDLREFNDKLLKSESYYDDWGRTTETRKYDVDTYSAVRTEYDALGRGYKTSNPFRPALSESPVWTTSAFDTLGRVVSVTTPDSAVLSKSYYGNQTTVTDQAGKKRRGFANALGQTTKVVEDPDTLAYETTYLFDAAGNLRKTTQGSQYRYFSYDSLGRLIRSKQPEQDTNSSISFTDPLTGNTQWAEYFTYDAGGNVLTKKDARSTISTFTYDVAGRVLTRSYTDSTPSVSLTYDDAAIAYSKGKLTSVVSSVSTTSFSSFDQLGRVTSSSQTMAGISQPYTMSYSYSIAGNLVSETYPSGRVVTNTVDDAGQLSKVTSQEAGQTERTYAQNFAYNAAGMIERVRLGNARWENYQYNDRLQVTRIGLGASVGDTSLLKLNFEYATSGYHDNNGTLLKQTITLPGSATALVQSFSYDALNRLQSALEMYGSSQSWKQTFVFDRFGNRTFNTSSGNTTTLPSNFNADIFNPTIDTSNNRYSTGQGYSYDAAGNVTANAAGQSFEYDAEHHQTKVKVTSSGATVATYQYDGSGKRVKKIVGTEETIFIYDAMGKSVAEYTLNSTTSPTVKTRYTTQDHLGSPRVITDGIGQVQERHDYLAYGEDAGSSLSTVRTTAQNYVSANLRQRYTGYERDDESGLDFAQARYYSSAHGRFTSVDPLTASATIKNPQTFNRYSYALNSPYKFTDPLGLNVQVGSGVNDPQNTPPPPPPPPPPPAPPLTGVTEAGSIVPSVQLAQNRTGTLTLDGTTTPVVYSLPSELQSQLQQVAAETEQNQLAYLQNRDEAVINLRQEWIYQDNNDLSFVEDFIRNPLSTPPTFVANGGQVIPSGVSSGSGGVGVGPVSVSGGSGNTFGPANGTTLANAANVNLRVVRNLNSASAADNFERARGPQTVIYTSASGSGTATLASGTVSSLYRQSVNAGLNAASKRYNSMQP